MLRNALKERAKITLIQLSPPSKDNMVDLYPPAGGFQAKTYDISSLDRKMYKARSLLFSN